MQFKLSYHDGLSPNFIPIETSKYIKTEWQSEEEEKNANFDSESFKWLTQFWWVII